MSFEGHMSSSAALLGQGMLLTAVHARQLGAERAVSADATAAAAIYAQSARDASATAAQLRQQLIYADAENQNLLDEVLELRETVQQLMKDRSDLISELSATYDAIAAARKLRAA